MSSRGGAVFLDRDGTIIEDVGALRDPGDIRLLPGVIEAMGLLGGAFRLFIVTNQCFVGEGQLTRDDVDRVHRALAARLAAHGIRVAGWYICPHARDAGCACRKPALGLLRQAVRDHGIDLSASFIVGDHPSDVLTGRDQGVRGAYVLTGHGSHHCDEIPADIPVFDGITGAAAWIMAEAGGSRASERREDA